MSARPNILLLYTDQQRWDALGANGNGAIRTPHLDRLAAEGVCFDHCFTQHPLCMPSRISFLTGRYPSSLRITDMGVPVPESTPVLPRLLGPAGYYCAQIGKLHFLPHANRDHRQPHPTYGFDELAVSDEPGCYEDAYRAWVRRKAPDQLDKISVGLPPMAAEWQRHMGVQDGIRHPQERNQMGCRPFEGREDVTHSAFVGENVCEFLRRAPARPFLCIAGFFSPHSPWVAPQRYLDLYDPSQLSVVPPPDGQAASDFPTVAQQQSIKQGYYAMVSEVDAWVGRILDTLEATGRAADTMIVFTSDHGEWLGSGGRYGKGYPGDDEVTRVPLLIRPPRQAAIAPRRVGGLVESVDVLPTLLELCGVAVPGEIQGRSLVPLMRGTGPARTSALTEATGWKSLRTAGHRYLLHADGRETVHAVDGGSAVEVADAGLLADLRHEMLTRLLALERPLARTWPY